MAFDGAFPATTPSDSIGRRSLAAEPAELPLAPGPAESFASPGGDLPPSSGSGFEPPDDSDTEGPGDAPAPTATDELLADLERQNIADRQRLRWTLLVATLCHMVLLLVTLPTWSHQPKFVGQPSKVFVLEQVRFQKPPAKAPERQEIPDPKKKRIPIPDPTPDDPEPLVQDLEVPDLPPTDADEFFFGIPEGPDPGFNTKNGGFTGDARQVGDGILPPVGLHQPQPRYTEEARQARIQGVVIVSCVIDEQGNVRNLKAVKGLPLGLTESALETLATWTYKPAHTNDGKPVAVYYHVTIGFWLQ